ncbi:hypothetical protein GCM10027411_18110 [Microbacterium aureliae]
MTAMTGGARSPRARAGYRRRRRAAGAAGHRVPDLEFDAIGMPGQPDGHRGAIAVAQRIGERLLQDAVDGQLDRGGRVVSRRRVHLDADRDTGGAHLRVQLLEVGEGGLRAVRLTVSQTRQQDADVGQCGPRRGRDRLESGGRSGGVGCRGVARTVCLRDDDGQGMRDDIVHVPGDAQALLLDDRLGLGPLLRDAGLARVAPCAPVLPASRTARARSLPRRA